MLRVLQRVQRLIQSYLDSHFNRDASGAKNIKNEFRTNSTKLQNLLALVERGVSLDTILPRIKEIEAEKARLERESERSERVLINRHAVKDAAQEAARFLLGFRDKMGRATILEQKILIRQIVQRITVDRAKDEISFDLMRIPKINNPILSAIMQNSKAGVHSKVCPEQDLNLHDLTATSS